MKTLYISAFVVIILSQILFTNAADYKRVKRQTLPPQIAQIIDTITRLGNPSNVFQMLSQAVNSIMKMFIPAQPGRRKRSVDLERNLHDYLVKASKHGDGHSVQIHDKADELDDEFNWRVIRVSNLPEMPPIPGITDQQTSIPKDPENLPIPKKV